ncbi:MAG: 2-amino-4-hydroxy-6-hydroxymethyldihydropteridine diphosphokinase [Candidatus Omnitrophica bacterium]|nr:2-amino-4-hydroxy-6-hydroxymethyldihydropteridine diphosphokinase [Candidatus Omnitrophota bacterium]
MTVSYLSIGSNLGDRHQNIKSAIKKIKSLKGTHILKISRIIETEPVGGPAGQKRFLNACLKIDTKFSPRSLLHKLEIIERQLGRKNTVRWGARTMDLDILFYGNKVIRQKDLTIPHKRLFKRDFVLEPLSEIIW